MKNIVYLLCLLCLVACGKGSSTSVGNGAYTVSGTVTSSGAALSGVTVTFTGTSSGTATTGSGGKYSFTGVNNGVYQVTAAKAGYVVTPAIISATVSNSDVTGKDFTATPATYNITGTVTESGTGLAGVTISLTGTSLIGSTSTTATSDSNGNYSLSVIDGSYTLTAAKTGYVIPGSLSATVSNAGVTRQDFTATASSYTISGTITSGGSPLSGATVTLSGTSSGTATTNSSGNYSFSVHNGSYVVTPTLTAYTFTPATLLPTVNNSDATGQNFTATVNTYSIAGTITSGGSALAGATVTLSGTATGAAATDSSGNYSFSGLSNGSYTVTPTKSGYTFTYASLPAAISNADATGINFSASTAVIQLAKTGQITSYAKGDDGDLQKGVVWPSPRFTDNSDGTVTDNLTGLIWLQNANCFGQQSWANFLTSANSLASGVCGLTDGSIVGQWRMPNRKELLSLVDRSMNNPALPATHPFSDVKTTDAYWSSTTYAGSNGSAWVVGMNVGSVYNINKTNSSYYVWPVRGGQ